MSLLIYYIIFMLYLSTSFNNILYESRILYTHTIFQPVFRSGPSGSSGPSRCMCECENGGKIWLYHRAFVYNVYINYFFSSFESYVVARRLFYRTISTANLTGRDFLPSLLFLRDLYSFLCVSWRPRDVRRLSTD